MTMESERNTFEYLRGLVRVDIRKKERSLQKFAVRPGQDPAEAEEGRAKIEKALEFRRAVLESLTTLKGIARRKEKELHESDAGRVDR